MTSVTLTVTSKGQVTFKRSVLEHLGVRPGDRVEVVLAPGGKVELSTAAARHDISAIFGMLHRPDQTPVTQQEIDDSIGQALAEDDDRIRLGWAAAHSEKAPVPRKRERRGQ